MNDKLKNKWDKFDAWCEAYTLRIRNKYILGACLIIGAIIMIVLGKLIERL